MAGICWGSSLRLPWYGSEEQQQAAVQPLTSSLSWTRGFETATGNAVTISHSVQVVACLAAAWSTAGLATAQEHTATVIKALADVHEVATKAADQLATALAATRVAEHCGTLTAAAGGCLGFVGCWTSGLT